MRFLDSTAGKTIRWIICMPVGLAMSIFVGCFVLAFAIIYAWLLDASLDSLRWQTRGIGSAIAGYAFVWGCVKVAPSGKPIVAVISATVLTVCSLLVLVTKSTGFDFYDYLASITGSIGAIVGAAILYKNTTIRLFGIN